MMVAMFSQVARDAIADTFMNDVVSIYPARTAAKGTLGPDFQVVYGEPTARHLNEPAHIEPMVGRREQGQGEAQTTLGELAVKVQPHVATNVRPGDEVRIETAADPLLAGVVLIVLRAEPRTMGLSTRLICRRAEAASAPGAS